MKLPLTIGTKVASAIYDADGVPVCVIDSMQEASRDDEREMARRIVACVNACEAIPTDKLEAMAADPIEGLFGRLAAKAIRERDELLAALEWLESMNTLHGTVEMLYVVDGYQLTYTYHDSQIGEPVHGATLVEAIGNAIAAGWQPLRKGGAA